MGEDAVPRDEKTVQYFDSHVPEYSEERLQFAADALKALIDSPAEASLVDLGCGAGNTLRYLAERADIRTLYGVDVSEKLLARAQAQVNCHTLNHSLLDPRLTEIIDRQFDVAVLAAVLHHLIGRTRTASRRLAEQAVDTAWRLVKPSGHLVVVEPVFYPRAAMTAVFYVKKLVSSFTSERVALYGYWNNIGAPVVSYYGNEQLLEMIERCPGAVLVERDIDPDPLGWQNVILSKTNTTLIARKTS
jgi:SAM-dependent methyltransferase